MFTFFSMLFGLIACGEKDSDTAVDTENDTAVVVQQGFILEDEMQGASGCADFVFYDHNQDDSLSLEVTGSGLAELAHTTGEVQIVEVDLTNQTDFDVKVNQGQDLTHMLCGDMIDPELETIVDDTFRPANGTLTLTVTAQEAVDGNFPAEMEVRIQIADFCAETGNGGLHHENCFSVSEYVGIATIGWFHG